MHALVQAAAGPATATVRGVRADQLDAPTPCREYDVRRLVNHLLYWGPTLEGAARKESVPPPGAGERGVDLTGGDWAGDLVAQFGRLASAWSRPDAWVGATELGGALTLPAATVGGMVLGEFVVHGWDLARATGQEPSWDGAVLEFLHEEVVRTVEQGRAAGVYGDPVPVPDSAPALARILGMTGRDPDWTPVRRVPGRAPA
jgi:uncharacterized protein (TIGR03086 family)